jgi:hypothetical protein
MTPQVLATTLGYRTQKGIIPMRYIYLVSAALLGFTAMQALAQVPADPSLGTRAGHEPGIGDSLPRSDNASNIVPADTTSGVAPTLPTSGLGDNAGSQDYLQAARASLVAGNTGQAQQSLEMAETRALDRSVPQSQANQQSNSAFVGLIRDALHSLGGGDCAHAIQLIDLALAS